MTKHETGTRAEWLAARLELLQAEKELTRRSDELAQRRQELPWVRIDKTYRFDTDKGAASLADLFRGRSQLLVYHFMFGPDYKAGCPSCSAITDGFNGVAVHLANHDVMLWAVSRAPLAKLQAYKRRMGWTFPWASSLGSDFNRDFNVQVTEEQQREGAVEYNYRREQAWDMRGAEGPVADMAATTGTDVATYTRERSCSKTASSTTPIPPMRADWTVSGACTSGSTAPPGGATRPASGGAAATSTERAEQILSISRLAVRRTCTSTVCEGDHGRSEDGRLTRTAGRREEQRVMLLTDKVAVIHGAGGAIGSAVARTFAREGARLFLAGRRLAPVEEVAHGIVAEGGEAEAAGDRDVVMLPHEFGMSSQSKARAIAAFCYKQGLRQSIFSWQDTLSPTGRKSRCPPGTAWRRSTGGQGILSPKGAPMFLRAARIAAVALTLAEAAPKSSSGDRLVLRILDPQGAPVPSGHGDPDIAMHAGRQDNEKIVGRLYVISNMPRNFEEDYGLWIESPFKDNGPWKDYLKTVKFCLLGGVLIWLIVELLLRIRRIQLWNAKSGRSIRALKAQTNAISALAVSPDERTLAVANQANGTGNSVNILDVTTDSIRCTLTLGTNVFMIHSMAFSPDGSTLAWATYLGGTAAESASSVTLDATGNVWVAGTTESREFPNLNGWSSGTSGNPIARQSARAVSSSTPDRP